MRRTSHEVAFWCAALLVLACMVAASAGPQVQQTQPAASLATQVESSVRAPNALGLRVASNVLKLPPGTYRITAPLNLCGVSGLEVDGGGYETVIIEGDFDDPGGAIVNMTGARYCTVRGVTIRPALGRRIGMGLFVARAKPVNANDVPASAGNHLMERVFVEGEYAVAPLVNFASECNVWSMCYFVQFGPGSCALISNGGLPEVTLPHGRSTMLQQDFVNCFFNGRGSGYPVIRHVMPGAGTVGDIHYRGNGISCGAREAVVSLESYGADGQMDGYSFTDMRWETEEALHLFVCKSDTGVARTFGRVIVSGLTASCMREAVYAPGERLPAWDVSTVKVVLTKNLFTSLVHRYAVVSISGGGIWPLGTAAWQYTDWAIAKSNFPLSVGAGGVPVTSAPAAPTTSRP